MDSLKPCSVPPKTLVLLLFFGIWTCTRSPCAAIAQEVTPLGLEERHIYSLRQSGKMLYSGTDSGIFWMNVEMEGATWERF